MVTKKSRASVDWSLRPRGTVSAAVLGAGGLVALAGVGELAHVSPLWAAVGTGVGALGQVMTSAQRQHAPGALLYRLGCWAGAGGWLTWTWTGVGDTWSTNSLAALAVGAVGAAVTAPLARTRPRGGTSRSGMELVPTDSPDALSVEWERRFRRVCRVAVQVVEVRPWENGAGYDVYGQLPPGPATRKQISAAAEALATDARLPEGCGVEVQPGRHRGEFILGVSTVNRLGTEVLPYPADYSPRSILDPVLLGEHRDSTAAAVHLREDSVLVVGRRGGGKTTLLDVLTLGIGRCRDAINWHIDMNGGGMSQAWLHPWLEGQIQRPPVDWCASTPEEALLMVTVALEIAKHRKSSYRKLKARANSKLLPVSPELPEIIISVDEGAEVLSPTNRDPITRQIRDGLEELQRIGRNEAVNVIISSLRPTQDMIAPAILKQSAVKMALFGLDEADLGHLYSWRQGVSMADLPTRGCAWLGTDSDTRPMKIWYLEPAQIKDAAVAIAGIRPDLDQASQDIANAEYAIDLGYARPVTMSGIYAGRHERMRQAFAGQAVDLPTTSTRAPEPEPAPAAAGGPSLRVVHGGAGGRAADWPDPLSTRQEAPAPATSAAHWPDPLPGHQTTSATATATTPAPAEPDITALPDVLRRALEAFDRAGDDRMHSETLAAELGVADPWALAELFRPYGIQTRPKFKRNGVSRRGYWREDIIAAARQLGTNVG